MKKNPKISVVMSVFNDEKYLKKAIDSILRQTFENFEFLIINDGSADSTAKILQSYRDPRIKIIDNKKNIGLTKSLNKGLQLARGEYIARHDSDDFSLPERLEKQVRFLDERLDHGLVGCWNYRIGANDRIKDKIVFHTDHDDIVKMLLIDNQFVHSSVMFRKECVEKLGGYNEDLKFAQDYDLWLRIAEQYKVANLGEFLHLWRYEKNGISYNQREEQKRYAFLIRDKFIKKVTKKKEWQTIVENSYERNQNSMIKKYLKGVIYNQLFQRFTKKSKKKISIIAIISAFNEEDIIGHVLDDFIKKGIQVFFIDHHSTDKTLDIVKTFLGKGVKKIEIFPEESGYPSALKDVYAWRFILKRKEELHSNLNADWYMHMDADAIVESPWKDVSISEAIQLVDALGYNCINFELFNFRPVENKYKGDIKPQDFFKYWEPADSYDELQIKCWKNFGQKINLVTSGGHDVQFKEKKVFPIKFIMKHYPIRSREHGIKKILFERVNRFDIQEKRKGWHQQYDQYAKERNIAFDKKNLLKYNEDIVKMMYLPFVSCFSILEEKNKKIRELDRKFNRTIKSIYTSRTWKVGRFATAPWRLIKKILLIV